jgi:hypothetical protein
MADFLIKQKGSKTIFFELSRIVATQPNNFIEVSRAFNIDFLKFNKSLLENRNLLQKVDYWSEMGNNYVFNKLKLNSDVKNILGLDYKGNKNKLIGYKPSKDNNYHSNDTFLSYEEIRQGSETNFDLSQYHFIIDQLLKLAQVNQTTIVFFLPVTINKGIEKQVTIPLYNSLPKNFKIEYPEKFLNEITNTKYLFDKNHLNSAGAEKYTTLLLPLLKPYFKPRN